MTYENNDAYINAVKSWQTSKGDEKRANAKRLLAERDILKIVGKDLNEKGANNFPLGLKITTGMSESWDMGLVDRVKNQFDDGLVDIPFFPFNQQWKPDNRKLALINESTPHVFVGVFGEALTIKPKKPSFEIKEKK